MKRSPVLEYGQWAMMIGILTSAIASWSRLSDHHLWQDVTIILSGLVFGFYGTLLATNWRGISRRYSGLRPSGSQRQQEVRRFLLIRVAGIILVIGALAAIASSIFWIVALFSGTD